MVKDHLGNEYESEARMLKVWHVNRQAFKYRLEQGWSLKEALENPVTRKNITFTDHEGNVFNSKSDMCNYWGISMEWLRSCVSKGWTYQKAFMNPPVQIIKTEFPNLEIGEILVETDNHIYYSCKCKNCGEEHAFNYQEMKTHKCNQKENPHG